MQVRSIAVFSMMALYWLAHGPGRQVFDLTTLASLGMLGADSAMQLSKHLYLPTFRVNRAL